jgi:asparagine synthase (glutamine-hydrolysing)
MSGICGALQRDGRASSINLLRAMMTAAPHRQADGNSVWCDGPVMLAFQQRNNLPAARCVSQPLRDECADLTLVLHGRIDNRRELARLLGQCAAGDQLPADAALVLRAYQHWGTDCSDRLVGDFAFAIWDGKRGRLFASRDPSGCIPFYYALLDGVFVFASELCQVLAHPLVPRRVNEGMVAEHLSMGITSKQETLYLDVQRLPPGHQLEVDAGSCKLSRYWQYLPLQQIHYRDPGEYQEHFLELFERAVADRLDCVGPPGITLSGGLDSPTIAGMAQSLLDCRGHGERLHSFSLTDTENPGEYDEGSYIKMVVDKWELRATSCSLATFDFPDWRAQATKSADLPPFPNDALSEKLNVAAAKAGVTTLFSGVGASNPLSGSRYVYRDLLQAGAFAEMRQEWLVECREAGPGRALQSLARSLTWPLMPARLRVYAERSRRFDYRSPFLTDAFVRRVDLHTRHRADATEGQIGNLAIWTGWWNAQRGDAVHSREITERKDARHGQTGAHPFLDRRLVEYLFALPPPVKRRGAQEKQLLIHSGLLPRDVARDRVQGDYSLSIQQALCSPTVQNTLQCLAIAELGWVNQHRVAEAVRIVQQSNGSRIWSQPLPHVYLWMVFSLELWYQAAIMRIDTR